MSRVNDGIVSLLTRSSTLYSTMPSAPLRMLSRRHGHWYEIVMLLMVICCSALFGSIALLRHDPESSTSTTSTFRDGIIVANRETPSLRRMASTEQAPHMEDHALVDAMKEEAQKEEETMQQQARENDGDTVPSEQGSPSSSPALDMQGDMVAESVQALVPDDPVEKRGMEANEVAVQEKDLQLAMEGMGH